MRACPRRPLSIEGLLTAFAFHSTCPHSGLSFSQPMQWVDVSPWKVWPAMTQTASLILSLAQLEEELRTRLHEGNIDLPVLPTAAQEVLRMTAQADINGKDLASKVTGDPALSAHVLRVANSALYRGNMTITSIRQAVGRLGLDLIAQIAASVAIKSTAFGNRRYEEQLNAIWQHSLRRGLCAREIARVQRDSIEHAFLGGLLRDLGQACVLRELDHMGEQSAGLSLQEASELAQRLSCSAGAALAQKWELQAELAAPMATAYAVQSADRTQLSVELGDTYARALSQSSEAILDQLQSDPAVERLGLDASTLEQVVAAKERVVQNAEAMS